MCVKLLFWFFFAGHTQNHRSGDGTEDEPVAFESDEYAARGAAAQQAISSKYIEVIEIGWHACMLTVSAECD